MKRFWFLISIAAFLALEGYCAYACAMQKVFNSLTVSIIMFFALSVVCIPLSVVLHELGHMLFGATVKIKAVPQFKLMGASSCTIIPKTDKNLKGRIIFTSLGGLIVNALCIALGIVALTVEAVPVHISALLPFSAYLFLLNAMPFGYSEGATDGLVVCELVRGDDSSKVMLNVLKVQAQVLGGKPFEEVDESLLFDVPQIAEDDINFISLTELRYEYFKARGDNENAQKYKQRLDELKKYL
ncbi:MAG: hypothetical protein K2K60_03140 [Clostridia bacterium]|nr:hypothetical protein [Clostridia bacterium]